MGEREPGIYRVSWVNRLAVRLDRLRIPFWLLAGILIISEALILQSVAWLDGTDSFPGFGTEFLLIPIWTWGSLLWISYLNRVAKTALEKFRTLLPLDDPAIQQIRFRFTNSPSRPVIVIGALLIILYLILVLFVPSQFISRWNPPTLSMMIISGIFMFAIGSGFYYHVINMLIMVDRTFKASDPFNLFDREPVFAFSELTARSSLAVFFFATLNILLVPFATLEAGVVIFDLILLPIGFGVFILPLWGAHRRLVEVKRQLQRDTEGKIQVMLEKLNACLDSNDPELMNFLNKALANLIIERDLIDKLPTWPWRKGLLTGVASALFIPTALLVIQIFVQRWLPS